LKRIKRINIPPKNILTVDLYVRHGYGVHNLAFLLTLMEIINQLISQVYIGKDDKYLIEWSYGGTAQLQANEWYPQKGENSRNFAQKQGEISDLA